MKTNNDILALIQSTYHKIVPEGARSALFQNAPAVLQRRMNDWDNHVFGGPLTSESLKLPRGPYGPARFPRRVNKICDEADWQDEEWLGLLEAMGESTSQTQKHRKTWEWAQGIYALQQMGLFHEDAVALGVGAGNESILFYLANQIKMVYATDIYGEGEFIETSSMARMLTDPGVYAKIPYREDHLTVMYMNGLKLEFPDNYFDFAFTFSSIEHFGGHAAAAQAVREMARVVKPGGAVIVTSEVILNGHPNVEFFLPEKIQEYLIDGSGLEPIEEINYTISEQTLENALDGTDPAYLDKRPHIVIKAGPITYTSFCLVQQKPQPSG